MNTRHAWERMIFSADHQPAVLSRAVKRGTLRRLARGIYTGDLETAAEQIIDQFLWPIVARQFPGAVFVDRSALAGRPDDAALFVVHPRQRPVELPGVTIHPRPGPGPVPGDMPLPDGLWLSSPARGLLDNLAGQRRGARVRRTLERVEVEEWIERLLQARGEPFVDHLRRQARTLAPQLAREGAMHLLDAIVGSALTTREDTQLESPALRARAGGRPYDAARVETFQVFADALVGSAPDILPAVPVDANRRRLLPFYEAYFSNFIEGTEFTLDEASDIIFQGFVPAGRPDDAHDIIGTYQIVADHQEMGRVPATFDDFDELLRRRHAVLLGGRPDKLPGEYKRRNNRAGATDFVDHTLVEGTLRRGFEIAGGLESPFSRAVYFMFLIAEVHPFADGNGRIARVMMNAELDAGGEIRIIIPTVYRSNYLSALKGATHNRMIRALVAMLSFARRYTARIDFSDRAHAEADLERTNAWRDPNEAEATGIRLTLP